MKEKNYLDSRTTLKVFALNCFRKAEYPEYLFLLFFLFDMNIFYYANKHLHEWIRQQAMLM